MACGTAHREEHVKQCITRGSCYSTQGRTCKAMHYTCLVVQHTEKNMYSNALHVGSWYSTQGRTCKAMHYTWLVVQHKKRECNM